MRSRDFEAAERIIMRGSIYGADVSRSAGGCRRQQNRSRLRQRSEAGSNGSGESPRQPSHNTAGVSGEKSLIRGSISNNHSGSRGGSADGASGSTSSSSGSRTCLVTGARLWEGVNFTSSATASPDLSASLWYHLGVTRARLVAFAAAAAGFERAADLLPTHPTVVQELAKCCQVRR